eukprot:CAMPEP_0114489758 /NCGR_PEP_ID=MMETSP0109-20121206/2065_1 /TAXON_ID=29199 /ORGANISM="Chlorarachnion reptans, Strain CCCM449" /LENGTH=247 /DNA_ID=CAMNT_0001666301 /DNA_START=121 /DNA_END=864 /DNA_ORIENTATION=+
MTEATPRMGTQRKNFGVSPMEEEVLCREGSEKPNSLQRNFSTPRKERKTQPKTPVSSKFLQPSPKQKERETVRDSTTNLHLADEVKDVVFFLNCVERRLEDNSEDKTQSTMTSFHSVCRPSIGIGEYIQRIAQFGRCSPKVFILAVIYIDRIVRTDESLEINNLTIHRLAITAVVVASKFLEDKYHSNAKFARIGGTSREELNLLELEFVFRLRFELCVTTECFEDYSKHISEFRARREASVHAQKH